MWTWSAVREISTALLNTRMKHLEGVISELLRRVEGPATWDDGDTTPSVSGGAVFLTANSGATTVTRFDNGRPGQTITVIFGDANTTLDHGANLILNGAVDFTGSVNDVRCFVTLDGTVFYESPQG